MESQMLSTREAAALFKLGSHQCVSRWQKAYTAHGIKGLEPKTSLTYRRDTMPKPPKNPANRSLSLEEQLKQQEELEYLRGGECLIKKAGCLNAPTAAQKTRLVLALRQYHRLKHLLRAANLAYLIKRTKMADKHARLKASIQRLYDRHRGNYGYRRITLALHLAGISVNHKTVYRLMQQQGLRGKQAKRRSSLL